MNYFKDCQTIEEARKLYRKLAMKLHPDKGGKKEDFQELQKQLENFKPFTQAASDKYFNAEFFMKVVDQLITIEGIEIEICGSWIWITSEKRHKEQIKAVKLPENWVCRWTAQKQMWYIRENYKFYKKSKRELSIDEIRDFYGSEKVEKQRQKELQFA